MRERGHRRTLVGTVVSDRMDKTVVVQVDRRVRHPRYGKFVTRREKYKAHDEGNQHRAGDRVEIVEWRPLSHGKRWKVVRLLSRPEVTA